ncbi:acetolactate synthase large subunit [Pseudomonas nitroreducens]|uniref:acetolactate synthase large subunit n=1 Tax=Pseudomonas nitroreducens TaxID=46680 RepID=UPI001FB69008|nr:acetolactate synthase large subunit [Pseudomonas nitroreducens]MCJ1880307.1 acetolactate synthase large subunit [Pseudomonas nitroreducens]MCJ1897347.1 acetolactate synthase large subunit [Pseudomonas nitroreducens]
MNGAQSLVKAAVASGIEYCFANPGTTEIPLVAALAEESRLKPVLSLFEGVCTGAADGYGRISGRPAMTLTHLGPGFANGIANLHNARRAHTPIVNVIGDHASWHVNYDPPLASDIQGLAGAVSGWVRTSRSAAGIAEDLCSAVQAAWQPRGQVASLILPMDLQARDVPASPTGFRPSPPQRRFDGERVEVVARALRAGRRLAFIVGDDGLTVSGLLAAGRLARLPGVRLFAETFPRLSQRGGGLPDLDRLPYFPEAAIQVLEPYDAVVCAGTVEPISYFGYEGLPSRLADRERLLMLAEVGEDVSGALQALTDALGLAECEPLASGVEMPSSNEGLTPQSVGQLLAAVLPEQSIVSIEGGTCGYPFFTASAGAARHRVLTNTGGAIGQGLPVGFGAALAAPGTPVFCLQSDGSAQYTIQTLWSIAREQLPVVILIAANHRYAILQNELRRFGVDALSPAALALTELDRPRVDWPALARGYGVPAHSVGSNAQLHAALLAAIASAGPCLIEMQL